MFFGLEGCLMLNCLFGHFLLSIGTSKNSKRKMTIGTESIYAIKGFLWCKISIGNITQLNKIDHQKFHPL